MDRRLAERSRTIDAHDLGSRIRVARVAAGLTQAQLAANDVTAAYVSRIEDGQRRPEFSLLGRFADRMGISLAELLEDAESPVQHGLALALDHAELAVVGGSPEEALQICEEIADKLAASGMTGVARRRNLIRARALEASGDLNGAILVLEDLTATPRADAEWLRSLIALSRCYRETGDLDRAIAVGENAQATLDELGLTGLTESIQLTVTVAAAYTSRGDLDRSLRLCMRAIESAEAVRSPIAAASAYWNASVVESKKGASQLALTLARKALAQFEHGEDLRNLARLRGHVADLQLELDPPDAENALATINQALGELDWSSSSPVDRASHLQTRARANLLLGNMREAREDIEASLHLLPEEAAIERACDYSVLGEIELGSGHIEKAREALLLAVQILTSIGADHDAAQLWFDLGGHLRAIGLTDAALDAFERAAASKGLRPTNTTSVSSLK